MEARRQRPNANATINFQFKLWRKHHETGVRKSQIDHNINSISLNSFRLFYTRWTDHNLSVIFEKTVISMLVIRLKIINKFLLATGLCVLTTAGFSQNKIDRKALVQRHNVIITKA